MTRGISDGDKVRIHVNNEASLDRLCFVRGRFVIWTVIRRPRDVGDTWTFERDGQVIEMNPNSTNFDGLELVERKDTNNV